MAAARLEGASELALEQTRSPPPQRRAREVHLVRIRVRVRVRVRVRHVHLLVARNES